MRAISVVAIMCLLRIILHFLMLISMSAAKTRVYYVATVDLLWDYAPSGINKINSKLLDNDS